jgi:tetratricopeptide (TPR) repeat protein
MPSTTEEAKPGQRSAPGASSGADRDLATRGARARLRVTKSSGVQANNRVRFLSPYRQPVAWAILLTAVTVTAWPAEEGRARGTEDPTSFISDPRQAEEDRQLREEQLREARQLYAEFPRSDAPLVLGVVHHEQGDLEGAVRFWEEALRLDPAVLKLQSRAQTLSNLGDALRTRGELARAEGMLREALQIEPRRQENRLRLAHLVYDQDRPEECLKILDEGPLEVAQAHGLRGQALQRLGRTAEARRAFEEAVRLNPSFAEGFYGLAMACARLNEPAQAEEYRRRFASLKADQQESGRVIRRLYDPLHTTHQSVAQTHTQVGWVYQAQGRPETAERLWKRAAAIDPNDTACRFHLLMIYQRSGRNQEALEVCREMTRADPTNALHQVSLGNLYVRLQRPAEAEAAFRKANELAPDRPEPCFALAQFYLQGNTHPAEAVRLAQRAVELAPAAPHFYVLSRALARAGDRPAALTAVQKACELDPGNSQYEKLRTSLQRTE